MRTEARELTVRGAAYAALIEAAYCEPALRALYPFTSHWTLRFSTTTRPQMTAVGPCLLGRGIDQYTVSTDFFGEKTLAEPATAQEAVAVAVRYLPSGLEPVTPGTVRPEDRGGRGRP